MEHHWARLVAHSPAAATGRGAAALRPDLDRLRQQFAPFPYFDNYVHLVSAELAGLAQIGRPASSLAVCGAGPLPLSGILAHVIAGIEITLIDNDPEAAALALELVSRLEAAGAVSRGSIRIESAPAERADLGQHDTVLVAALVSHDALMAVAGQLAGRRQPATLLARSARGLVEHLIYEPVDVAALRRTGLCHLGAVRPRGATGTRSAPGIDEPALALAHRSVLNTTELFAVDQAGPVAARDNEGDQR